MRILLLATCFLFTSATWAQHQNRFISFAVTDHHSAYPFSAFAKLFTEEFHPGFEAGYGFNWRTASKHDWYQAFRAGYFYHRFVQHAIPIYTQLGYHYKPFQVLQFTAALGAGYLHSIPATAVLELNNDGTYKKAKGIGRGQALIIFSGGIHYVIIKDKERPATVFMEYQQQVQTPFIKSYVPLLPYNSIAVGLSFTLKAKN